jgi:hypothetical protein
MLHNADEAGTDRRAFLKAALYVAPVVMTLKAKTAYAQLGSSRPPTNSGGNNPNNNQNNGQGRGRGPAGNVQWEDEWNGGNNGRGRGRGGN